MYMYTATNTFKNSDTFVQYITHKAVDQHIPVGNIQIWRRSD